MDVWYCNEMLTYLHWKYINNKIYLKFSIKIDKRIQALPIKFIANFGV